MTDVLNVVLNVFNSGASKLQGGGIGLLSVLVSIETVWAGLMVGLSPDSPTKKLFKKMIYLGIFTFIVLNWASMATTIMDGFVWAGTQVGGGADLSIMHNPSGILDKGMQITAPIWLQASEVGFMDGEIIYHLLTSIIGLAILVLHFIIAMQVFIAVIEFYIVASFGVIFIPWGVNQHTKFIAERYFGAILAAGTKLMVTWALLGVCFPIIRSLKLTKDPDFSEVVTVAFGVATIAFLIVRGPSIASGLMSGSANLGAGDAMSMGAAAMLGGASGASTAVGAVGAGAILAGTGGAGAPVAAAVYGAGKNNMSIQSLQQVGKAMKDTGDKK